MKLYQAVLASLLLSTTPLHAETIADALKNCGQVQNSLKRLVCYDKIVNELNRYGGLNDLMSVPAPLPAKPSVSSSTPAMKKPLPAVTEPAESSVTSEFGLSKQDQGMQDTDEKIYANVLSIKKDGRKKNVFTLDNGHVWRQTEGSTTNIREGDTIYVEKGALGSFHMSKEESNRRIRVKRVK